MNTHPVPFVSVILMHHLDTNRPYLEMAIRALQRSQGLNFDVLLFSDADEPVKVNDPRFRVYNDKSLNEASLKIHKGMEMIHSEALVLTLSDDVVVSEWLLHDMAAAFQGRQFIMNPFSNSDCRSLYEADIELKRGSDFKVLGPDMVLEDLAEWEEQIITYPRAKKLLVATPAVSFFCTMMNRSVFEKVGKLDPLLEYRHNDQDFCIRAMNLGIPSILNFGAFAFHFGSRTLKQLPIQETQKSATEHFLKKHSTTAAQG